MESSFEEMARKIALESKYTIAILYDGTGDEGPGYVLGHPELPGCMAEGETLEEAMEYLQDATYGYILLLLEHGLQVPEPESCSIATSGDGNMGKTLIRETDSNNDQPEETMTITIHQNTHHGENNFRHHSKVKLVSIFMHTEPNLHPEYAVA